jgi:hypothetical protein
MTRLLVSGIIPGGEPELYALALDRKLTLRLRRTAWINMDWVWAAAPVVTGIGVLLK